METPERRRRNRLEQLQADTKAHEAALAGLEAEIAEAARDASTAEAECRSAEARLQEVQAAIWAADREEQRTVAVLKPSSNAKLVVGESWAVCLVGLGTCSLLGCVVPVLLSGGGQRGDFPGLAPGHFQAGGLATIALGFFIGSICFVVDGSSSDCEP